MFIYPLVINGLAKVNLTTGIWLFDGCLLAVFIGLIFFVDVEFLKAELARHFYTYFTEHRHKSLVLTSDEHTCSLKIRAIMHWITQLDNPSIYCLKEKIDTKWAYQDETHQEIRSEYCIDQTREFHLDTDIYGILKILDKKKQVEKDKTEFKEYSKLTIYTKRRSLKDLQRWIEDKVKRYNKYLRSKTSAEQLLVTVMEDKNHELNVLSAPWEATSTFENSYSRNADYLVGKIRFFLDNKAWYIDHGIPYTLGFLLHGPPGCGKTKFIKQIMNLTGRHGIDIKLNDKMDLNLLKRIIHEDQITDDLIIPQGDRILILEDIDAMGELVKDRDSKSKTAASLDPDDKAVSTGFKIEGSKLIPIAPVAAGHNNNNLSFLLNMIDGLNEGSGRILIMTTNKPEILDKALIRPGRVDHIVEFGKCSLHDIQCMIELYYAKTTTGIPPESRLNPELHERHTSAEIMNMLRTGETFADVRKAFYTEPGSGIDLSQIGC